MRLLRDFVRSQIALKTAHFAHINPTVSFSERIKDSIAYVRL